MQIKSEDSELKILNFTSYKNFLFLLFSSDCNAKPITKLKLHTRQYGGVQDSTFFTTVLWKIILLPLYYHYFLEASKLGSIDWNEAMLEGTRSSAISLEGNGSKIRKVSKSGPAESNDTTLQH